MGPWDIKAIKELSWYLTVPLFTCALLFQASGSVIEEMNSLIGMVLTVSENFAYVVVGLLVVFGAYIWIGSYLEGGYGFPFTVILATFLLSIAAVGLMAYFLSPNGMNVPINVFWFFGMASLGFNLYELHRGPGGKANNQ